MDPNKIYINKILQKTVLSLFPLYVVLYIL